MVADDPDPGPIGEVRYRIISDFDKAGSFAVNPETGDINITSRLDFDARCVHIVVCEWALGTVCGES